MPNTMKVFAITTSLDEEICLAAIDEWSAKQLFWMNFPRKRLSSIREITPDPAGNV